MTNISKDGTLGQVKLIQSEKGKGGKRGFILVKMDDHALGYIIRGLECRVAVYEKMQEGGKELPEDDRTSFEYTKLLKQAIEDGRNSTLQS